MEDIANYNPLDYKSFSDKLIDRNHSIECQQCEDVRHLFKEIIEIIHEHYLITAKDLPIASKLTQTTHERVIDAELWVQKLLKMRE